MLRLAPDQQSSRPCTSLLSWTLARWTQGGNRCAEVTATALLRKRDKKYTVVRVQKEETESLQKKSILLGLFSAVMIVGVDVTITKKNPSP